LPGNKNFVQAETKCLVNLHLKPPGTATCCCVSGGLKVSVKKTRAPADLEENLDDRNVPAAEPSTLPPGFLSPSVKEYLELGKSIPGNKEAVFSKYVARVQINVYISCLSQTSCTQLLLLNTSQRPNSASNIFKYGYSSEDQKSTKSTKSRNLCNFHVQQLHTI